MLQKSNEQFASKVNQIPMKLSIALFLMLLARSAFSQDCSVFAGDDEESVFLRTECEESSKETQAKSANPSEQTPTGVSKTSTTKKQATEIVPKAKSQSEQTNVPKDSTGVFPLYIKAFTTKVDPVKNLPVSTIGSSISYEKRHSPYFWNIGLGMIRPTESSKEYTWKSLDSSSTNTDGTLSVSFKRSIEIFGEIGGGFSWQIPLVPVFLDFGSQLMLSTYEISNGDVSTASSYENSVTKATRAVSVPGKNAKGGRIDVNIEIGLRVPFDSWDLRLGVRSTAYQMHESVKSTGVLIGTGVEL